MTPTGTGSSARASTSRARTCRAAPGFAKGPARVGRRPLCFLHADTRLPSGWPAEIEDCLRGRSSWGAFRLRFADEAGQRRLPLVATGANLRARLLALPFGDQAPFVMRELYEEVDGHPPWSFLDDLELSLRLRRHACPRFARGAVFTSPRRYLEHGAARTVRQHFEILVRRAFGADPEELLERYRR